MNETNRSVTDLFTKGSHHRNISEIYIVQNLFNKRKEHRTISLNSHYIVVFKALQLGMASYPLRRVEVKTFTVPQGNLSWVKENLFLGQLSKRMVVGFVDNTAFNGQFNKNPFRFQNYGINIIAIYKDGEQIFSKPLQPGFARNRFVRSYLSLFTETNQYYVDEVNGITRNDYPNGNTLFAFDLTANLGAASGHWELVKHGSIRLDRNSFLSSIDGDNQCSHLRRIR